MVGVPLIFYRKEKNMKKIIYGLGSYTLLSFAMIGFKYVIERVKNNVRY